MLFNSFEFLIFFPVVFLLYWCVFQKHLKAQNAFILVASYVFYGWWDWRFLGLIAFSSLVDYWIGLKLGQEEDDFKRKVYLGISLGVNLGLLGFFKYFNFFIDSTIQAINALGFQANEYSLQLILPVGISFYTFQTMSYTIDIYRKQMVPTKDPVAFFAYVSFFPQLVAGPIERASNLLPQFFKQRVFDYTKAMDGMRQILWGFFMKLVIADNCAVFVDQAFKNPESQPGINLLIGAIFFSFQIYGDFGGYSNIAIGTGKLLGFDLMRNFAYPYFSRDIAEFWRRWHISLSTWFRDYVYIPLGGSKVSRGLAIRNIFIIFLVSGFWHGANWTFIVWGGLNAIYFLPLYLSNKNRINTDLVAENSMLPSIKEFSQILTTFLLTTLTWVFFRSPDVGFALVYLKGLPIDLFQFPKMNERVFLVLFLIILFVLLEWKGRKYEFAIQKIAFSKHRLLRYGLYYSITMMIFLFARRGQEFIYFQF
ncbi:MBOAT family O-acyltransferase [Fontibacter flavus]|uniref:MBOAT family O-acyltransferase n=1 Tax=Fontibacter flavus TaxID=654838 RepID=A0ABV6FUC5_9BACT